MPKCMEAIDGIRQELGVISQEEIRHDLAYGAYATYCRATTPVARASLPYAGAGG